MIPKIFLMLSILMLTACGAFSSKPGCNWRNKPEALNCLEEKFPSRDQKEIEIFLIGQGFFKAPQSKKISAHRYFKNYNEFSNYSIGILIWFTDENNIEYIEVI